MPGSLALELLDLPSATVDSALSIAQLLSLQHWGLRCISNVKDRPADVGTGGQAEVGA